MLLSSLCRSRALAALISPTSTALPMINRQPSIETHVDQHAQFIPSIALPMPSGLQTEKWGEGDLPVSFALPPAPLPRESGEAFGNTKAARSVDKLETPRLKKIRIPFRIPVPLESSGMRTIPTVRQMLVQHAQDTYAGVGLVL